MGGGVNGWCSRPPVHQSMVLCANTLLGGTCRSSHQWAIYVWDDQYDHAGCQHMAGGKVAWRRL
jgi:hypothetical protein